MFLRFLKDNSGATQMEYAFICLLVVLVALGGILALGDSSTDVIDGVEKDVTPALKRAS